MLGTRTLEWFGWAASPPALPPGGGAGGSLLERSVAGVLRTKIAAYEDGTWSDSLRVAAMYEDFAARIFMDVRTRPGPQVWRGAQRGSLYGSPWLADGRLAPPMPDMVEVFAHFLATEAYERKDGRCGYAPSTVKGKLSSLNRVFVLQHGVDIIARCVGMKALHRGLEKRWVDGGRPLAEARSVPIMGSLLRQLLTKASAARSWRNRVFRSMAVSQYAWLLRFGEAGRGKKQADTNTESTDSELRLMTRVHWGRLTFLDAAHRVIPTEDIPLGRDGEVEWVDWGFGREKSDRIYGGQIRSAQRNRDHPEWCPVATLVELLVASARCEGFSYTDPVFLDRSKPTGRQGLTNRVMNTILREHLVGCVVNGEVITAERAMHYSSHGFRGGACTELFLEGVPVDRIKAFGRWRSDAYEAYRHLAREIFADMSRRIISAPERHILGFSA